MSKCTECHEDLRAESLELLDDNIKEVTCPYCHNEMEIEYDEDYSEGHKQSIVILNQKKTLHGLNKTEQLL